MTLVVYNTLTRRSEVFQPLQPGRVKMYCCGITAYDYCHLGHARTCITWDLARRYLRWLGYQVTYVQNFTDIDDKILNRARTEGTSMEAVAERFIAAYFEDMAALKVEKADFYPRATHSLDGIRRLIAQLEAGGYAYASEGDVYYDVHQFPEYGKLSGRRLEDLQAGASGRVEQSDPEQAKKQDPFDFALWKSAKVGEPSWESPWGPGRPGWHIECSAMVKEYLGETIDLHVGGSDLIFPHHENEIAQSEAATGRPLARYWLHNGMVKVGGEKMSKSLGNFTTIRDLLPAVDAMAVRLLVLQGHYRKPLDFAPEALQSATNGWQTLAEGLSFGLLHGRQWGWDLELKEPLGPEANAQTRAFREAVDDDFNFAGGLAVLFELAKELRRQGNLLVHQGKIDADPAQLEQDWRTLTSLAQILGLEAPAPVEESPELGDEAIAALVQQRVEARQQKNFAESDRIRDLLKEQGIILIDQPDGQTRWRR
ncbi:MAG: cysteine--tRNA ligase [Cyanobacteria bacterium RI_101]|nr:cysteine--tRNA ligase [Cyanobacteria bacterium RI_101]